ncbi:MAG: hypothetical protein Alis3KO_25020 [Aliiglaciecola sp.]
MYWCKCRQGKWVDIETHTRQFKLPGQIIDRVLMLLRKIKMKKLRNISVVLLLALSSATAFAGDENDDNKCPIPEWPMFCDTL